MNLSAGCDKFAIFKYQKETNAFDISPSFLVCRVYSGAFTVADGDDRR